MSRACTDKVWNDLCKVIPGGVNSGARAFVGLDMTPMVVAYAERDTLVDVDGRRYLDFCGSWGPMLHGHAHPEVLQAVRDQMEKGLSYGITAPVEEKLARKVTQLIPSIEQIRFVNSGTEATMTAARLARGFTGRSVVVKFVGNYHGHADFFLVQAGSGVAQLNESSSAGTPAEELSLSSSAGVPADMVASTIALPYNNVAAVRECFAQRGSEIAAVIVEPIAGNMGVVPGTAEFLETLRHETERAGALLIFDEVITGFRVGIGGAQELYGIQPDLTTLGKVLGGGMPAAAFGGSREIMAHLSPQGQVYQAGTLSGNPLAMAAGLKQLELLEVPGFYQTLEAKARRLLDPLAEAMGDLGCVQRVGSMFTLFWGQRQVRNMAESSACDRETFNRFFHHLFDHGVYIPPSPFEASFISMAHRESELDRARDLMLQFLA